MEGLTLSVRLQLPQDPAEAAVLRRILNMDASAACPIGIATPAPIVNGMPAPGEYWPSAGGIFVGTAPALIGLSARHLIASVAEEQLKFGGYDHDTPNATSHVDGGANTKALLADSEEHPAARWAAKYTADGHDDFHLPSRMDLLFAFLHAPTAFNRDGWYWSSTQVSRSLAFAQGFAYGISAWTDKDHKLRVRAFRWIPLTA